MRRAGARHRQQADGLPDGAAYAPKANEGTRQVIADIRTSGIDTLVGIAKAWQARGARTPRANVEWQPTQVARLLAA